MTYIPDPDATDGARIASVETIVCDMHQRLFGNGQPGVIALLERRIGDLEKWFWRISGGAAVVALIWQVVTR